MKLVKKIRRWFKMRKFNLKEYAAWVDDLSRNKSLFVPFTETPYQRKDGDVKIFAYYLTQFHAIPENDDAHGKGFTEWTAVASCTPQYAGHFQPKIPYDTGFYDLNRVEVMARQAELARAYGVYGFCFYYYWFSGRKVLETPLYQFLHSDIDMPFHLCWANENWSKLWDGGDRELILEQRLRDEDARLFFADLRPFIKDKRYEKIGNKPILMIYRPALFEKEKVKSFLSELDELARENGFDGFYYMASNCLDFDEPREYGFEGIIEFAPHTMWYKVEHKVVEYLNPACNLHVVDLCSYVDNKRYLCEKDYTVFKCCFPSWDNSPRKSYSGGFVFEMAENTFEDWLTGIIRWTMQHHPADKRYAYINAWNEWAEGAILEPTTRYGYKALDTVKRCMEKGGQ